MSILITLQKGTLQNHRTNVTEVAITSFELP